MTTERDFDRIAAAWMADGPEELSDRVIDAAVDQIHLTRQRRAARLPRRLPSMTYPARIAALVAVGVLILTGFAVIARRRSQRTHPDPSPRPERGSGRRSVAICGVCDPCPAIDQGHHVAAQRLQRVRAG